MKFKIGDDVKVFKICEQDRKYASWVSPMDYLIGKIYTIVDIYNGFYGLSNNCIYYERNLKTLKSIKLKLLRDLF
jgi:hypothetical protein